MYDHGFLHALENRLDSAIRVRLARSWSIHYDLRLAEEASNHSFHMMQTNSLTHSPLEWRHGVAELIYSATVIKDGDVMGTIHQIASAWCDSHDGHGDTLRNAKSIGVGVAISGLNTNTLTIWATARVLCH